MSSEEITVKTKINGNKLWSAVFGSAFETMPWWKALKFVDCDWDQMPTNLVGHVRVGIDDPEFEEGEKIQFEDIRIEHLVKGLEICIEKGYHHCGIPISVDLDYDSCAGDVILQCAIFGELVYG